MPRFSLIILALWVAVPRTGVAADLPLLSSLKWIRQPGVLAESASRPVDFEATVTFIDPVWNFYFVADGDEAIYAYGLRSADVKVGNRVRLTGKLRRGDVVPVVEVEGVSLVGEVKMPNPVVVTWPKADRLALDCKYIITECVVQQVLVDSNHALLFCTAGEQDLFIHVAQWGIESNEMLRLIGRRVECTGNLGLHVVKPAFSKPGVGTAAVMGSKIFCNSMDSIRSLEEDVSDWKIDPETLNRVVSLDAGDQRFCTRGQVSLVDDDPASPHIVLFDEYAVAPVATRSNYGVHPGMILRVDGWRRRRADGSMALEARYMQILGHTGLDVPPVESVAEAAGNFRRNHRIHIEGEPLRVVHSGNSVFVEMHDDGKLIDLKLKPEAATPETLKAIAPEYAGRIRAIGVATPVERADSTAAYQLVVAESSDVEAITMVARPVRLLTIGLTTFASAFLVAMLWVRLLRERVFVATEDAMGVSAQLRSAYEAIDDGILALNRRGDVIAVNSAFQRVTGFTGAVGETGDSLPELLRERLADPTGFNAFWERSKCDSALIESMELELFGEETVIATLRTAPITVKGSEVPIGRLVIARDETENRELQTQLLHSNKLEAVGRLVGGVAHDFNNVLMAISANLTIAQFDEHLTVGAVKRELSVAEDAAHRGADIIRRLLNFSGRRKLDLQPNDVNAIITRLAELISHTFNKSHELVFELDPDPMVAMVDSTAIEQVLLNLYMNARDAMPEGGKITTRTSVVLNSATNTEYVVISVLDEGVGIGRKIADKIFEPFFTTKAADKGTGLGLSVSFRAVQQHDGSLQFKRRPEGGSEFQVVLPLDRELTAPVAVPDRRLPRGSGTVLVVDDEDVVRAVAETMLRKQGFRTISASDGFEALAILDEDPSAIDCVLLDLTMPGISGREVLGTIKSSWPQKPVVLCSGYLDFDLDGVAGATLADDEVPKPYSMQQLVTTVCRYTSVPGGRLLQTRPESTGPIA